MAEPSTIPAVESAGIRRRGMGWPRSRWSDLIDEESTAEEFEQSESPTPGDPRRSSSLTNFAPGSWKRAFGDSGFLSGPQPPSFWMWQDRPIPDPEFAPFFQRALAGDMRALIDFYLVHGSDPGVAFYQCIGYLAAFGSAEETKEIVQKIISINRLRWSSEVWARKETIGTRVGEAASSAGAVSRPMDFGVAPERPYTFGSRTPLAQVSR